MRKFVYTPELLVLLNKWYERLEHKRAALNLTEMDEKDGWNVMPPSDEIRHSVYDYKTCIKELLEVVNHA